MVFMISCFTMLQHDLKRASDLVLDESHMEGAHFLFSLLPLMILYLSVSSAARTESSLAGVAAKIWWRGGAGCSSVDIRLEFDPVVASWSRLSDPSGQIWHIPVLVFFVAMLQRRELWQAGRTKLGISTNKALSSFSGLAFGRGTERWMLAFFNVIPRRKKEEKGSNTGSFNKRFHHEVSFHSILLALSAGHGGEGEESVVQDADRWCWGDRGMVSASDAAISKRRHRVAAAIFGQKDGLAVLVRVCVSSCFLHRRIFSSLVAPSAPAAPSGPVHGGDRGGRICRLCIGGSSQGLDHVFVIFVRVLRIKVNDLFVIFLFVVVLHVNMCPPPD
jgi:hypothetical protein